MKMWTVEITALLYDQMSQDIVGMRRWNFSTHTFRHVSRHSVVYQGPYVVLTFHGTRRLKTSPECVGGNFPPTHFNHVSRRPVLWSVTLNVYEFYRIHTISRLSKWPTFEKIIFFFLIVIFSTKLKMNIKSFFFKFQ